jgi:Tol biopolymer transport system component
MRLLPIFLTLFCISTMAAQTSQVEFGKNRVQYHKDFESWEQYESDNFITYWYGEGRLLGQSVVQMAEYDFGYVQKMLEHRMNDKVQLIVYRDVTDLKQSNIGSEEVFSLPGNQNLGRSTSYISATQAKFLGNKAFVYYNGDHTDLRRQVREAMASVYIEHMLYGSSVQEVVQNAVLLNLPPWFKTGLVSYLGEDWNTDKDDQLRQLLASSEYENFKDLAADYPQLAGHSFWHYVAQNYGKPTVSNLLYLTRINRSVENGFLYVLGSNYDNVLFNWMEFYRTRFNEDLGNRMLPTSTEVEIKNKKHLPVTQVKISPDGTKIAYVFNEIGRYKVYLQDLQTGEREIVHKGGQRNLLQATDYNYPLLDFSPTNQELAILYEHRDRPRLMRYDLNSGKEATEDLDISLDRVFSMAYIDPGSMIMTASAAGQTDLYRYALNVRAAIRINNDFWDDLDAVPVKIRGRQGVLFSSNRQTTTLKREKLDTTLPIGDYDLWYYDLDGKSGELVQITDTPFGNERQPTAIDDIHFSFLSDASGIYNRYQAHLEDYIDHYEQTIYLSTGDEITMHADSTLVGLDSLPVDSTVIFPVIKERAVVKAVTNLSTNIEMQASSGKRPVGAELFLSDNGQTIRTFAFDTTMDVRTAPTAHRQESYRAAGKAVPAFISQGATNSGGGTLVAPNQRNATEQEAPEQEEAYLFQTRFKDFAIPPGSEPVEIDEENILNNEPQTVEGPVPTVGADSLGQRPNLTVVTPQKVNRKTERAVNALLRGERPVAKINRTYKFINGKIKPYRLTFRINYVKTEADNDPLFAGLNSFSANPTGFTQQPLGILFKGNIIDLFEDYSITGGVRVPTSFNGTEYFATFEDRVHRLDKSFSVYRRNRRLNQGFFNPLNSSQPRLIEENTILAQYGVRYPLDVFTSLRATGTVRRDRVQDLPTELAALQNRPESQARVGAKIEYVYDNTLNLATNLRMGSRYKVYADFYKSFNISFSEGGESTGFEPGFRGIVGFDARHYQRLDKRSILAIRLAGSTNFGSQRLLYYLGGADNSLTQNFNEAIPTPQVGNFVFQDLANPLRGFDINIRNGGTYLLSNAEVRIPIFNYLFRNLRSKLLRDFQVVSFFDIGTAWSGSDPFDEDNPVNITTYPDPTLGQSGPVSIRVRRFRDPIIYGYGVGARTTLFGYYIRADYAWGVETGIRQKAKLHLSLGYDF